MDNSSDVFFRPSANSEAFGSVYNGLTPLIIRAPIFPAFISATKVITASSLPCLVMTGFLASNALLPKAALISNAIVCAFTSLIPVINTPLLPAFFNSDAAL